VNKINLKNFTGYGIPKIDFNKPISTITKMRRMTIIITLKLKTSAMKRTTRKIINEIMSSIKNITLLSAYPKSTAALNVISAYAK
jgi:hypothetical protein